MTVVPSKVTRVTTQVARVSKADKEVNLVLEVMTRGIRDNKVVRAVVGNKVSKEICQIAGVSRVKRAEYLLAGRVPL